MPAYITSIWHRKKSLLLLLSILILASVFESMQQLYYVRRYNISKTATFWDIFSNQSFKWCIWLLFTIPIIAYTKRYFNTLNFTTSTLIKYTFIIIGTVLSCILCIACIQTLNIEGSIKSPLYFSEYVPFLIYQKAPIFILSYIAIAIVSLLHFKNKALKVSVDKLISLKEKHIELYTQLKQKYDDKTAILNIKIGNKRKIIPTDTILWIEADDYCVKVHTLENAYAMRASLKSLEDTLDSNFVRVHRKAIANMRKIETLDLSNPPHLILKNEAKVPIAKHKIKMVKSHLASI